MLDADARTAVAAALANTRFRDLEWYDEVDSTNRAAVDLAYAGAPEGTVVLADYQTEGRGRRGRRWVAPRGSSLLMSVILCPPLDAELLPLTTLATGVAACRACRRLAGSEAGIGLKWPNDVVVADAKLGGILCEALDGGEAVVAGVGINVAWASPPEGVDHAVTLNEIARNPVDRLDLLVGLLTELEGWRQRLDTEAGRAELLDEWRKVATTPGQHVRVELPAGEITGRAVDVDSLGRLLVEDAGGFTTSVSTGDVVHVHQER